MQGATYILQKINRSEAPAYNILQVCLYPIRAHQQVFCCLLSLKPDLIYLFFTRDGVSEGQFYQVLLFELQAIRKVNYLLYPVLSLFVFR
jgi:hypothetical protein